MKYESTLLGQDACSPEKSASMTLKSTVFTRMEDTIKFEVDARLVSTCSLCCETVTFNSMWFLGFLS